MRTEAEFNKLLDSHAKLIEACNHAVLKLDCVEEYKEADTDCGGLCCQVRRPLAMASVAAMRALADLRRPI